MHPLANVNFTKSRSNFSSLSWAPRVCGWWEGMRHSGMAPPHWLKNVQSFLGFANFYRRFINNYSEIIVPLTRLTRKDIPWLWSEDYQQAFSILKLAFTSALILIYWNPNAPIFHRVRCLGCNPIHKSGCHKLHLAITPRILARFPRSKMRRKALMKTFQTMPKTCQSDQYSSRYQLISAGHWSADISGTAKHGRLLPRAHGSSLQYASDDNK